MNASLEKRVLKGVSRSFYLSLRLLPRPMRGAASLAYLLARTSDTLADSVAVPVTVRIECLRDFGDAIRGGSGRLDWPVELLSAVVDARERSLLEHSRELCIWLENLPSEESRLVREVLEVILSGQSLDLERFADASFENPVALSDDAALEDYAWRVAGSVGAFWTKLGFVTLRNDFSSADEARLLEWGISYGKGLQLVNILRDMPEDLAAGRCYLPVADPWDRVGLLACHVKWLARAREWVGDGENYAKALNSRRLSVASVLPALIARETLGSLEGASWEDLQRRVKIPRRRVYQLIIKAFVEYSGRK